MPDQRQAAHERHLLDVRALRGYDDAADYHSATIGYRHLGFRRFRIKSRNSLNSGNTGVDLRVLYQHVHEHRAFRSDLWCHLKPEHRVDILHGNRVVDGRLNRDLGSLLDGSLLVVLSNDFRLRKQFTDALGFCRGDEEVDRKVRRAVPEEYSACRSHGWEVG